MAIFCELCNYVQKRLGIGTEWAGVPQGYSPHQTKNAYYELVPSNFLIVQPQNRFFTNMASKDMGPSWLLGWISGSQLILYGSACQVELQNNLWCLWWQGLEVTACKPELSPSRIVNYSKARSLLLDQDGADRCDDHCGEGQCTYTQNLLSLQNSS